jgi:hypothetical protein
MKSIFAALIFCALLTAPVFSQDAGSTNATQPTSDSQYYPSKNIDKNSQRTITARYITESIVLDGTLDESIWQSAERIDGFWQNFPSDTTQATHSTQIRFLYDDNFIYVGIEAEAAGDQHVVSSLRRDFSGRLNDNVSVMFDTYRDGNNAFVFSITPFGAEREALAAEGGAEFNDSWETKWKSQTRREGAKFTSEFQIPFASLKFREGETSWGLQAFRIDIQGGERSTWGPVPQNQRLPNLAFAGEIVFEKPLQKPVSPIAIIPYINQLAERDFSETKTEYPFKTGLDAKISIGSALNLDLTINPDFSNVEVDDIVTNLTRFELRLPEKRQFFIDNSDLFATLGNRFGDARPFFSRRIGLAEDLDGNLIQNQITAGARLSGKLNQDWRIGVLAIQTDEDPDNEIASYSNSMAVLQRKVFARSSLSFFAVNRQTSQEFSFLSPEEKYNRVVGSDFTLASADNSWTGKFYLHKSFQPGDFEGNLSSQASLSYDSRSFSATSDWGYVDQDFRADLGFVPRVDIFKNGANFEKFFYPGKGAINQHTVGALLIHYWRPSEEFKLTDRMLDLSYEIEFQNQSSVKLNHIREYTFLVDPFDPTDIEDAAPIPGNRGYDYAQTSVEIQTNRSRLLTATLKGATGSFFNGSVSNVEAEVGYRVQPYVNLRMNLRYDAIRMPDPQPDADYWIVSPRLDITFTSTLYWTTLVQYSNQADNFGINSRLQWRFAPLSDLFLVYNDNYLSSQMAPQFRSVNLKLTYWFSATKSLPRNLFR